MVLGEDLFISPWKRAESMDLEGGREGGREARKDG